jgi:putative transposase
VKAYTSNLAKPDNDNFTLHFKKKNAPSDSIVVPKTCYTKRGVFYPRSFGKNQSRVHNIFQLKLEYEARIVRTILVISISAFPKSLTNTMDRQETKSFPLIPESEPFVLDMIQMVVVEVGESDILKIESLCHEYDELQSKWSHPKTRHGRDINSKEQEEGYNVEFATKLMNSTKSYPNGYVKITTIYYSKFETQKMVSRNQRKINSRTARNMMTLSHYRFRTRLMNKAREYPNCRVILCTEEYTSKTCGECGFLHHKLGGSKVFKCPGCKQESDRDRNGSRIFF